MAKKKTTPNNEDGNVEGMKAFAPSEYWKILSPNTTPIEEPNNPTFNNPRAPTIGEADAEHVPIKYNFSAVFDCPVFKGMIKVLKRFGRTRTIKNNEDGSYQTEDKGTRMEGCVWDEFMFKNNITIKSKPTDYINILFLWFQSIQPSI